MFCEFLCVKLAYKNSYKLKKRPEKIHTALYNVKAKIIFNKQKLRCCISICLYALQKTHKL